MPPTKIPVRAATITRAAGLSLSLLALCSPVPLAFAVDDTGPGLAGTAAANATVHDSPDPAQDPTASADDPPAPEPTPDPDTPNDVPDPDPSTPPVDVPTPVDPTTPPTEPPAQPPAEEPSVPPKQSPAEEPVKPVPPPPHAPAPPAPPPPVPLPPANQPPLTDWSPGSPGAVKYFGSGDQGIPLVGANGLIGDNYPAYYKSMANEPVIWDEWNFAHRQCTSFVAWRLNQANRVPFSNQFGGLTRWGNAGEWDDSARSLGFRVDITPTAGAIAYSDPFTNGSGAAGHVAWVAKVLDDGRAVIEEYNAGASRGLYNARIVPSDAFTGYIHLKDLVPSIVPAVAPVATANVTEPPAAHSIWRDDVFDSPLVGTLLLRMQPVVLSGSVPAKTAAFAPVNFAQPFIVREFIHQ